MRFNAKLYRSGLMALEVDNVSTAVRDFLHGVVTNQWSDTEEYKLRRACGAFYQGEAQHRHDGGYERPDGTAFHYQLGNWWVLIEFWTKDQAAINAFIDYCNAHAPT